MNNYFKRKITRNPDDNSGYMVLKPLLDENEKFNKLGCHYSRRGLLNFLVNAKKSCSRLEIVVDSTLSGNGRLVFNNAEEAIEALGLKQRIEAK